MASYLDSERLAAMVRTKRGSRGLREIAAELGNVSPSTLSRIENEKMPDMETFLLLCDWLRVPPGEFLKDTDNNEVSSELDMSERVVIQLRADKSLDPAIANALASLVKAAYRDLKQEERDRDTLSKAANKEGD